MAPPHLAAQESEAKTVRSRNNNNKKKERAKGLIGEVKYRAVFFFPLLSFACLLIDKSKTAKVDSRREGEEKEVLQVS